VGRGRGGGRKGWDGMGGDVVGKGLKERWGGRGAPGATVGRGRGGIPGGGRKGRWGHVRNKGGGKGGAVAAQKGQKRGRGGGKRWGPETCLCFTWEGGGRRGGRGRGGGGGNTAGPPSGCFSLISSRHTRGAPGGTPSGQAQAWRLFQNLPFTFCLRRFLSLYPCVPLQSLFGPHLLFSTLPSLLLPSSLSSALTSSLPLFSVWASPAAVATASWLPPAFASAPVSVCSCVQSSVPPPPLPQCLVEKPPVTAARAFEMELCGTVAWGATVSSASPAPLRVTEAPRVTDGDGMRCHNTRQMPSAAEYKQPRPQGEGAREGHP